MEVKQVFVTELVQCIVCGHKWTAVYESVQIDDEYKKINNLECINCGAMAGSAVE